eukprot:JP447044.1.p1 GENE.JP447044.1~~JP447044.1.p1  ORF type:complete len:179 (-),score=18.85 JP447044.1:191-703(-)
MKIFCVVALCLFALVLAVPTAENDDINDLIGMASVFDDGADNEVDDPAAVLDVEDDDQRLTARIRQHIADKCELGWFCAKYGVSPGDIKTEVDSAALSCVYSSLLKCLLASTSSGCLEFLYGQLGKHGSRCSSQLSALKKLLGHSMERSSESEFELSDLSLGADRWCLDV